MAFTYNRFFLYTILVAKELSACYTTEAWLQLSSRTTDNRAKKMLPVVTHKSYLHSCRCRSSNGNPQNLTRRIKIKCMCVLKQTI